MSGLCRGSGTPADEHSGVKLLLDQNLSHRLVAMLADIFPDSAHVRNFDLQRADDATIWEFAKSRGYVIVSKDNDFHQRSFLYGHPPKVVWLRLGNCSTEHVAEMLRRYDDYLSSFEADPQAAFLVIPG